MAVIAGCWKNPGAAQAVVEGGRRALERNRGGAERAVGGWWGCCDRGRFGVPAYRPISRTSGQPEDEELLELDELDDELLLDELLELDDELLELDELDDDYSNSMNSTRNCSIPPRHHPREKTSTWMHEAN